MHNVYYYFTVRNKVILVVSTDEPRRHDFSKDYPNVKPYCGLTSDKTCNCFFWKNSSDTFSGKCLIHIKNNGLYHSYAKAFFSEQSIENTKSAINIIRQIPNEAYSDASTEGYVTYILDESKYSELEELPQKGCAFYIRFDKFQESLAKNTTNLSFDRENYRGEVRFHNRLGKYWIDKRLIVMSEDTGEMWQLKKHKFNNALFNNDMSQKSKKCKQRLKQIILTNRPD